MPEFGATASIATISCGCTVKACEQSALQGAIVIVSICEAPSKLLALIEKTYGFPAVGSTTESGFGEPCEESATVNVGGEDPKSMTLPVESSALMINAEDCPTGSITPGPVAPNDPG